MSTLNEVVNLPNFGVANGIVNRTSWQDNLKAPLAVPAGSIIMYAGYTGPSGYFLCDGRAVSRYLYTDLFNAIGTTYGAGNGTSTFNIPNFKSYTPVCMDTSVPEFSSLGQTGGEIEHTLTLSEMPIHLHSGPTELAGSHFHTGTTELAGSHFHTGTTDSAGTHTHNYQDAYFAENIGGGANNVFGTNGGTDTDNSFYWRTSVGGYSTSPSDIATSSTGAHQHDFTTSTQTSHQHDFTTSTQTSHQHNFTTTTSGGNQPHNNLQPYIVMNYIIKF